MSVAFPTFGEHHSTKDFLIFFANIAAMPPRRLIPHATPILAAVLLLGCVERTITVTSDPPGSLVYLNDREIGRTPVTVPFLFYGKYDVRLEHEDYKPLWTQKEAVAPWWEAPGPDLIAEMIPNAKAPQNWHFVLEIAPLSDDRALIDRAMQLRAATAQPNK